MVVASEASCWQIGLSSVGEGEASASVEPPPPQPLSASTPIAARPAVLIRCLSMSVPLGVGPRGASRASGE